ncbi:MAG: hypothetical protein AB7F98_02305 [Novosphingobium sp.]
MRALRRKTSPTSTEIELPDEGVTLWMRDAAGKDLFRPGRHLLAGALTGADSWRREIEISLSPPELDTIGLTVSAGAFSGRVPMLTGSGTRYGVGELSRWRENNAWNLGVKFTVPGSGLNYAGGYSWSQYSLTEASRFRGRNDLLSPRPQWRNGNAWWHKVTAEIWNGETGSVTGYAFFGKQDEAYRTFQSRTGSPLIFGGRTFEAGGEWRRGRTRLSLSYQSVNGAAYGQSEASVRLRSRWFDLRLTSGNWSYSDEQADWATTERHETAKIRISLRGDLTAKGKGLLPDWLSVSARRKTSETGYPVPAEASLRSNWSAGLGWSRSNSETEVTFTRETARRPENPAHGFAAQTSIAIDVNHTLSRDWWDFSIYGSLTVDRSVAESGRFLTGGASLTINREDLPKLSLGIDIGSYDLLYAGYDAREHQLGFHATIDLTKYLPGSGKANERYLLLKAHSDMALRRDTFTPQQFELAPAAMLVFGSRF